MPDKLEMYYFAVNLSILLAIQRTKRMYCAISTTITASTMTMLLGALHTIRGMEIAIPITGNIRIARIMVRFFLRLAVKSLDSAMVDDAPTGN